MRRVQEVQPLHNHDAVCGAHERVLIGPWIALCVIKARQQHLL